MKLEIKNNISLKDFTTYKTGGSAKFLIEVTNNEEMMQARHHARAENLEYILLGGGSNMLFADDGYDGLVILNKMDKIRYEAETVTVEGGVSIAMMVLGACKKDLGGISGMINVPGSVGGAVYGNAGIPDIWIGDILLEAVILPEDGYEPTIVKRDYFEFDYRYSILKKTKDIILSVTLNLEFKPEAETKEEIKKYSQERNAKQPIGKCCGSFFKNPEGEKPAGWLIENAGCKGMKVGDAEISEKHANFIMNTGNATTKDILDLALKAHKMVKDKFGVSLKPEVQIIPDNPFNNL